MFYSQLFTSNKGTLAKIWLAAHWERKLTKAHVFECNLETTVRDIISQKMKIGLRISGHLLIGVVRIFSRKTKYLLDDCSDALIRIRTAFRPDETDLPVHGLEAKVKAITLPEDFAPFDTALPDPSDIDVVDHFSLNQSRTEEITLKEDFGNSLIFMADFGEKSQSHQPGLLDMGFENLTNGNNFGDAFGDEDKGLDLLDFLAEASNCAESNNFISEESLKESPENSAISTHQDPGVMEVEPATVNETTLLTIEQEAYALEPVPVTPKAGERKKKRKRKLVVDETKELSNKFIKQQLSDDTDLLADFDLAPPTQQIMEWKETGSADKLLVQPCITGAGRQIKELFRRTVFKKYAVYEQVEQMREEGLEAQAELSVITATDISIATSSADPGDNTDFMPFEDETVTPSKDHLESTHNDATSELTQPELPSEDSMFVHPSCMDRDTWTTPCRTQSVVNTQSSEDGRISRHAQKLLNTLRVSDAAQFSLRALCEGHTRSEAAHIFYTLLILKKRNALELRQSAPYEDIVATPGPSFDDC